MKPYQHIENMKLVIDNLKFKLQYSKNKVKDAEDINKLIDALKSFDSMLVSKYKTNALNGLISFLFRDYLMRYYVEDENKFKKGLPIPQIIDKINSALKDDVSYLVGDIKTYLIEQKLDALNTSKTNSGYIKLDKNNDIDSCINEISNLPTEGEIKELINLTLYDIKKQIIWNLNK
jgi:hypothetical protein